MRTPSFGTIADANFNPNSIWVVTPGTTAGQDIAQGSNVSQRVGNKIRTKRLVARCAFVPLGYDILSNPSSKPVDVKLWLLKIRPAEADTQANLATICSTKFFQSNSGDSGMFGDTRDLVYPPNSGVIQVLATKTFKLGNAASTGSGVSPANQYYANNDYKYNKIFNWDLTKHIDKNYVWNDAAIEPMNRRVYIVAEAIPADGSTANSLYQGVFGRVRFDYTYSDV